MSLGGRSDSLAFPNGENAGGVLSSPQPHPFHKRRLDERNLWSPYTDGFCKDGGGCKFGLPGAVRSQNGHHVGGFAARKLPRFFFGCRNDAVLADSLSKTSGATCVQFGCPVFVNDVISVNCGALYLTCDCGFVRPMNVLQIRLIHRLSNASAKGQRSDESNGCYKKRNMTLPPSKAARDFEAKMKLPEFPEVVWLVRDVMAGYQTFSLVGDLCRGSTCIPNASSFKRLLFMHDGAHDYVLALSYCYRGGIVGFMITRDLNDYVCCNQLDLFTFERSRLQLLFSSSCIKRHELENGLPTRIHLCRRGYRRRPLSVSRTSRSEHPDQAPTPFLLVRRRPIM
ncbi:GLN phosphoribosyl pyrophosphate amidotransferase2 [Striga asiatica]|uniref:GLN phosphoribosyl pyrophosphate amidotransferase2 n=1 Tax=Striga asiatica TaxID=4170 RepID=A0A5A7RGN7_STRAF|nr:GLN phosphoribosyl pyrophosphate amidotransferase2 [Striga asiatica]